MFSNIISFCIIPCPRKKDDQCLHLCFQGKRLAGSAAYDGGEVSDEDEAANVQMDAKDGEKVPKKKEKQHIKLSQELSNITAMKSTGFKPDASALPGQSMTNLCLLASY